ncbi:MAG TPA: transglycosylase domain-containing protein [Candidatus Saccharimonadales bacterium]|nr:transglycosylase domain-containing protein [Candidatus Saccharimonadales bacterium]
MDAHKTPGRRRPGKNVFTTKSGNTIKLNRSLGERMKASQEAKARKRAAYLSTLPKNRFKRILYQMHPKRLAKYWFSREGGIMALKITGIGIVVGFLLLVGVFAYFRKDLPNIKDISGDELGGSITYYARDGQTVLWQDYDAVKRMPVAGDEISKYVKDATIAIEDKNFYKHGAFDVQGITRAAVHNFTNSSGTVEGGSTITQQLVKLNQNWTEDRSITRKFKELILAVELEREYSKEDILNGYLNIAPYGNVQYGVESASQDYFGKSAKDLTLAEAAMLAALPKSPSTYAPTGAYYTPEDMVGRQRYIIDQMYKQKMITKEEADQAKAVDIIASIKPIQPKYSNIKAPYFVLAAKGELEDKYGDKTVQRGGWKVTTTVDMKLQTLAEEQVTKGIRQITRQKGDTAAFAAIDVKTAQMVALVGGPDFNNDEYGQVNFAQEELPPGSSIKPYDYAVMINETTNTGAGSVLYDTQAALPGYPCTDKRTPDAKGENGGNCLHDYDKRFPGPVTIRYALGGSRNVPAVKAMLSAVPNNTTASVNKTISTAEAMGLKSGYKCYADAARTKETQCYASSAIGDGAYLRLDEHVNGYATLSRLGAYVPQTYILKIQDAQGKTINEWKQPKSKQIIKPDAAYIVDDILADPDASYLRADRKFHRFNGWHFGIKTGTTNDSKDAWMMSMSPRYAAGVWAGHHTGNVEMTGSMESMTQPILQGWMQGAHKDLKGETWTAPSGIKKMDAYVIRGKISSQAEKVPSPNQDIFPSWYQQPKGGGGSQTIDKVSNKLATSCTPELAKQSSGNSNANIFSADIFMGTKSSANTNEQDDVHKCDDARPELTLVAPDTCSFTCNFTVTVTQGTHPLSGGQFPGTVNLMVNGAKVASQGVSGSPSTVSFAYTPTETGTITVEAQVTDSVLYDAAESATVTTVASGSP